MDNGIGGGSAAPTGCYKCGRPGHWSRDCPSNPNHNPDSSSNYPKNNSSTFKTTGAGFVGSKPSEKPLSEKPKKVPRTRPKLTPELLLSDDGIGYILRHFPRAFKYHGRGHEVKDLRNLLGLYAEWHSHLLSYYSFDQFVHKVEQVGATRRVKTCLGGLRERVANGGDPTKLHEPPPEHAISNNDQEAMNMEEPSLAQEDTSLKSHGTDDSHEDMFQEIYKQATEEPSPALHGDSSVAGEIISSDQISMKELLPNKAQAPDNSACEIKVSEDQRSRMEANRLKALEKAAARVRASASQTA